MTDDPTTTLRFLSGAAITPFLRLILYSTKLSWGAKCLGIAMFDLPIGSTPTNAALARKLHSHPTQISRWRSELCKVGIAIRVNPKGRTIEARAVSA